LCVESNFDSIVRRFKLNSITSGRKVQVHMAESLATVADDAAEDDITFAHAVTCTLPVASYQLCWCRCDCPTTVGDKIRVVFLETVLMSTKGMCHTSQPLPSPFCTLLAAQNPVLVLTVGGCEAQGECGHTQRPVLVLTGGDCEAQSERVSYTPRYPCTLLPNHFQVPGLLHPPCSAEPCACFDGWWL
jgi:hypothetical protein